jgi:Uma2 family endonuclease
MSAISIPIQSQFSPFAVVPKDFIWRLSVNQYHRMIRAGILTEDDQVELLEGMLVYKMPKNPAHRIATRFTMKALNRVIPAGWYVDTQEPVTLEDSEPEPDVMVARGETDLYRDRHPGARDLALVVEVSDATLQRDRESKKRAYARSGVSCYWVVNLIEHRVEVYSDPAVINNEADYSRRSDYGVSDEVPFLIEGKEIAKISVRDLLP